MHTPTSAVASYVMGREGQRQAYRPCLILAAQGPQSAET